MVAALLSRASPAPRFAVPSSRRGRFGRRPGVLVVDDEAAIRRLLKVALQQQGFDVWLAANGEEAQETFGRHGSVIDLVVLDVIMPGPDGPETLAALQQLDSEVRCCFISGFTGQYSEEELLMHGAARVFSKPFRLTELGSALWQMLSPVGSDGA
jgi:DNA-binding response OmpR family regulator